MALSATCLCAQDPAIDLGSSVRIDLPADSPVTLISTDMGTSRANARGGALMMDLHMTLTLRNSGARRVRGITLLITAQEFAAGGKGSVARPCIDVAPNENFSLPIDIRLVRPVQQSGLVHVQLDGVIFDDLSFFGPNRLNSRRAMTVWEMEARRDRANFKQILQNGGEAGLRNEVLASLARQNEHPALDVASVKNGPAAAGLPDERPAKFAFLSIPDSPVRAVSGRAGIAGNEARAPQVELRNLASKPIRYVEMGWIVQDREGNRYVTGSTPGANMAAPIPAGQAGRFAPDVTLRFSRAGRPVEVESITGFVSQVEFEDGKAWVPSRADLNSSPLLRTMAPSTEVQRLSEIYSKKGLAALIAELGRY